MARLVEPLRQEPEASFQNATSRDWQKAFTPQRELAAFCSGVTGSLNEVAGTAIRDRLQQLEELENRRTAI